MSVSQTRGVIVERSELTDTPQRAESLDAYKVCREGNLVFNQMKIRSGAMGVAPEDGLVSYHYEVMRLDARWHGCALHRLSHEVVVVHERTHRT